MTHCNVLLSAFATVMTLVSIMPCGACAADAVRAASLGHDNGTGLGSPAMGRAVQVTGTALFRMADRRIAKEWNSHGLMKQLDMLPTPATGSATGGSPADGTAR